MVRGGAPAGASDSAPASIEVTAHLRQVCGMCGILSDATYPQQVVLQ